MGMGFERYISDNWIRSLMAQSVDSVTVNMRVNSIFVNIINATSMNVTVANDKEVAKLPAREFYGSSDKNKYWYVPMDWNKSGFLSLENKKQTKSDLMLSLGSSEENCLISMTDNRLEIKKKYMIIFNDVEVSCFLIKDNFSSVIRICILLDEAIHKCRYVQYLEGRNDYYYMMGEEISLRCCDFYFTSYFGVSDFKDAEVIRDELALPFPPYYGVTFVFIKGEKDVKLNECEALYGKNGEGKEYHCYRVGDTPLRIRILDVFKLENAKNLSRTLTIVHEDGNEKVKVVFLEIDETLRQKLAAYIDSLVDVVEKADTLKKCVKYYIYDFVNKCSYIAAQNEDRSLSLYKAVWKPENEFANIELNKPLTGYLFEEIEWLENE